MGQPTHSVDEPCWPRLASLGICDDSGDGQPDRQPASGSSLNDGHADAEPSLPAGGWRLRPHASDTTVRPPRQIDSAGWIVGRANDCDLRIAVASVSRRHARLWIAAGQLHVQDLGSVNGTRVNGRRIESAVLAAGDVIEFALATYRVEQC